MLNPLFAFEHPFFVKAFIVVILLSLVLPLMGITLAGRGFTMVSDTLSHTSLAGIAIGLAAGTFPMVWSILISLVAALIIEFIRRRFPKYSELALTITLALSLGLTGILSQVVSSSRFESYLFGSLYTINDMELYILIGVVVLALAYEVLFYRSNIALAYNEEECKANGMKVIVLSTIDTVVTSLLVALASNIIGALMVACFVSIPVAISLKVTHSSKGANYASIIASAAMSILGLFIAYTFNLHVGGTIVLTGIAILVFTISGKYIIGKIKHHKH